MSEDDVEMTEMVPSSLVERSSNEEGEERLTEDTDIPIDIRAKEPGDVGVCWDNYRRIMLKNPLFEAYPKPHLIGPFRNQFAEIMRKGRVTVAVNPLDQSQVFGWCSVDLPVVHFVYVRQPYRRMHVAKRLLEQAGVTQEPIITSHWLPGARFADHVFDPELLYRSPCAPGQHELPGSHGKSMLSAST